MSQPDNAYRPSFTQNAFRWFYSLLLVLVMPFVVIKLMFSGKQSSQENGHRRFERFGLVARPPKTGGYLFHCVSVGEVVAASCLIQRLMLEQPQVPITVTTTTATGSARVRAIFGDKVHHCYLPFDLPVTMTMLIKRIKPSVVMITEVELWPNMIHVCWRQAIPVMVINARMTVRSARRYKKLSILFEPMLRKISHVCAQGQRDFDNYQWLGLQADKLTLTNNIKFDQVALQSPGGSNLTFKGLCRGQRPVLIGGSTHQPEESVLLEVADKLRQRYADLLLILVPRHPQRFESVSRLLERTAANFQCSSQSEQIEPQTQVLLVDEMGKLNQAYQIGTMAFVGGSIANRGGHNALEPAAAGLPILMGPHTYNNPVICEYLQEQGALTIAADKQQLLEQCQAWLADPKLATAAGEAGLKVLKDNSGALNKTLQCVGKILEHH